MTVKCADCKFFTTTEDVEWQGLGYCHRFPPQVATEGPGSLMCLWPKVVLYEWCGEFQPKESKNENRS